VAELIDADPELEPRVVLVSPTALSAEPSYFEDGREGTDRWGNERRHKTACGTGWDGWVCPLYVEEACPGELNAGTRWIASENRVCDLACGRCGGGERADTTDVCGHVRGQPGFTYALWEMGGLRLDRYMAPPVASPPASWPCGFAPTLQWGGKEWMPELHASFGGTWPMVFTSVKTAHPGNRRVPTPLRERLGGHTGLLGVHGLVKDDLLDDMWEERHRFVDFCKASGVDVMCTWQLSYYDVAETAGWIYNVARAFELYRLFAEAGFPVCALDVPPFVMPWLYQEYLDFIDRNAVKCVTISMQTFSYIHPLQLRAFGELHEALPDDAAVIIFGVNTVPVMIKVATRFAGRPLVFSNVEPYTKAAFFRLTDDRRAPPGWTKPQTFAWNARYFEDRARTVLAAVNEREPEPLADYLPPVEGASKRRRRRGRRMTPRPRSGSRRSRSR
jgi:hypothetical protein